MQTRRTYRSRNERKKAAWRVLSVLRRGPADAAGPRTAPVEKQIHLGYMPDKSKYMYLGRFLRVTLNTYQDTSRYMYLGRFVAIHQDTSGYKIKIHVSWARHDDTLGYIQDTSRYMFLVDASRPSRSVSSQRQSGYMRDMSEIHSGYIHARPIHGVGGWEGS